MNKINRLKIRLTNIIMIIKIIISSITHKKNIFILETPVHGNLGDQAIIYAENKYINENLNEYNLIEVSAGIVHKYLKLLKRLINEDDIIFVHGGGFLGTIWMQEELNFRLILEKFKNNKIIVFPQTIYFDDNSEGNTIMNESKIIYQSHPNLHICCREKYSYDLLKNQMNIKNVYLIPDMVLYLNQIDFNENRNNILFCIRNDKEKLKYDLSGLKKVCSKSNLDIDYTDTVIDKLIYKRTREQHLYSKINQFSKYKVIVTDRLHGMVFAYISKTPCLVLQNKSWKIKGSNYPKH